jgi:hypothetical protein
MLVAAKLGTDPAGHSGRPDVARLLVDRRPMSSVIEMASPIDDDATAPFPSEHP